MFVKPKEIEITDPDGVVRRFVVSRFPAIQGREIVAKYPLSAVPKLGDYAVNEETMIKLMAFCAVVLPDGQQLPLTTRALIDNHTGHWETLARLEMEALQYNVSFFGNGKGSTFLEAISQKAEQWITGTLIPSLAQSSRKGKQP